jgi:hypothetical protein
MEVAVVEIGREETKQRRVLNKEFVLAIKKRARGTAWRVSKGVLIRDFDGWFISAPAAVWLGRRRTQIELQCKPMKLDPVFWEIVETEANVRMPLSFRYWGAWTCRIPTLVEHELDERSADPATMASQAFDWLDGQIGQFKSWTTEHFLHFLRQHPRTNLSEIRYRADYWSWRRRACRPCSALKCCDAVHRANRCNLEQAKHRSLSDTHRSRLRERMHAYSLRQLQFSYKPSHRELSLDWYRRKRCSAS